VVLAGWLMVSGTLVKEGLLTRNGPIDFDVHNIFPNNSP
jgi:hypothetical protein